MMQNTDLMHRGERVSSRCATVTSRVISWLATPQRPLDAGDAHVNVASTEAEKLAPVEQATSTSRQRPPLAQPPRFRNYLEFLVARGGFEPPTFGL